MKQIEVIPRPAQVIAVGTEVWVPSVRDGGPFAGMKNSAKVLRGRVTRHVANYLDKFGFRYIVEVYQARDPKKLGSAMAYRPGTFYTDRYDAATSIVTNYRAKITYYTRMIQEFEEAEEKEAKKQ